MNTKLTGLVAATHTPFDSGGQLNLAAVEKIADHLAHDDVHAVFIGGTTGESQSLTVDERLALTQRWSEVVKDSPMRVVVHVGSNCLADSRTLAAQAQHLGVFAIAAFAPSYFKPASLDTLIDCCREIADAAPALPFYYYDIPGMTGVKFSMSEFLAAAPVQIPTLAGLKFTNTDVVSFQKCLRAGDRRFDIPWGVDECLLAALTLGALGAVGSSYNFAAPVYHRLISAFSAGDFEKARAQQYRAIQLIDLLSSFGYMAAAKAVMGFRGVNVGRPRLPNTSLSPEQIRLLRSGLETLGFFDWL